MDLTFFGAAREVTGSCHVVRTNGRTVLLDVGLFQGRRSVVAEKNTMLPVSPSTVDSIVLSHAHIDHAGRLPYIVRKGYRGPIYATPATIDLCRVMLADSAHIQEKDADFLARRHREHAEPLYDGRDVEETIKLMRPVGYGARVTLHPGLDLEYSDAGHILGSASVALTAHDGTTTRRLGFSGDIGRSGQAIIRDPVPLRELDGLIMESTYGGRHHGDTATSRQMLADAVSRTAARGGRVLIPAFAVGRTQEIIYALGELAAAGKIPRVPIVIDSPLATEATRIFERHVELFDRSEPYIAHNGHDLRTLLTPDSVEFTESVDASKAAMQRRGPMIVVAASGMAESGRILHHLIHGASDDRNTILIAGFQAEHTLGRRIVERRPQLSILGETVDLRADVVVLNGYSAHADEAGLLAWHDAVRHTSRAPFPTWLVHGEPEAQDALRAALAARGVQAQAPARDEHAHL